MEEVKNLDKYQVMPPLTEQEYQELKSSIAEHGVQVAIEYDEDGNVLDGHHRIQFCKELGIQNIPKVVKVGMGEQQKLDYALMVKTTRRHLNREQKQELIRQQLRQTPEKPDRQIAELVGADNSTVSRNRQKMEEASQLLQRNSSIGIDGKVRPRKRKGLEIIGEIPQCDRQTADGRVYPEHRENMVDSGQVSNLDTSIGADAKAYPQLCDE